MILDTDLIRSRLALGYSQKADAAMAITDLAERANALMRLQTERDLDNVLLQTVESYFALLTRRSEPGAG